MKHFAIFFNDLTQEAQDRYCKELFITKDEGNFEIVPIAIVDIETEDNILFSKEIDYRELTLGDCL